MMGRLLHKLKNSIFIQCLGYWTESTTNGGSEFDCDTPHVIMCEDCLICGGMFNPYTGKKDIIRYFFYWLERLREENLSKRLDRLRKANEN